MTTQVTCDGPECKATRNPDIEAPVAFRTPGWIVVSEWGAPLLHFHNRACLTMWARAHG